MAKSELESDVESLSEGSSSSQDDKNNKTKKKQRKISLDTWDNVERQSVGRLPVGIDGLTIYEIKGFVPHKLELLQYGRKWKKTCPTFWRGHTRTRFSDCKGSVKCTKEHCPFKMQFGVTNTTQFEKKLYGKQVCKGCGSDGAALALHVGTLVTGKIRLPSITLGNTHVLLPRYRKKRH